MSIPDRALLLGSGLALGIGGLICVVAVLQPASAPPPAPPPTAARTAAPSQPLPAFEPRPGIASLADADWVAGVAADAGIPDRAMAAYAGAALRLADEQPACGLGWNTLAGIGLVESEHGRIDGGAIDADGVAVPAITGIPLTGEGTAAHPDTDAGALDGDPRWDRAVGPMQFIPQTWADWGADGNADGMVDPQQIDDAALAAGRYLCAEGGDLASGAAWLHAVRGYNDSDAYLRRVADAAAQYARFG